MQHGLAVRGKNSDFKSLFKRNLDLNSRSSTKILTLLVLGCQGGFSQSHQTPPASPSSCLRMWMLWLYGHTFTSWESIVSFLTSGTFPTNDILPTLTLSSILTTIKTQRSINVALTWDSTIVKICRQCKYTISTETGVVSTKYEIVYEFQ